MKTKTKTSLWLFPIIVMGVFLMLASSCQKEEEDNNKNSNAKIPELTTEPVSSITQTSSISGGNISSDGGANITERGICWSTGQTPTISDNKTMSGAGTGPFTSNITGLSPNTKYYVRAYAKNSAGTGYGNTVSFTTLPPAISSKAYLNLTFNTTNAFFASDGTMSAPVNASQAIPISSKIDITFIFNHDYTEPGFFDPIARSQHWVWDDYYISWLSDAVETRYYTTNLTKAQFDAAVNDESKIGMYFSQTSTVVLAPHAIFPTGSCIGGRQSHSPTSITLSQGQVFGFKNTLTQKRGLIYIRTDQEGGWPIPVFNFNTKVDIIREN